VERGYGQKQTPTPGPMNPMKPIAPVRTGHPESIRLHILQEEPCALDLVNNGEQAIESDKRLSSTDVEIGSRAGAMDRIDQSVEIFGLDRLIQPRTTGVEAMGTTIRALVMDDEPDRIGSFRLKSAHSR
jgi:hypothetical protein